MRHIKLPGLMSREELISARVGSAHDLAEAAMTAPTGSISVSNADGTRTVIGAVKKGAEAIAHIGDTTAPPRPIGIAAGSSSGALIVYWVGQLAGAIPPDFDRVKVYAESAGSTLTIGELTAAGSVTMPGLPVGQEFRVYATAEDNNCAPDGTPKHNVSARSDIEIVTITAGQGEGVDDLKKRVEKLTKQVDEISNSFSADAQGAHVGDKASAHTTVDHQGLHVMEGAEDIATITKNVVALAKGAAEAQISMVDSAFHLGVKRENNPNIGAIQTATFSGDFFDFRPRHTFSANSEVLKFSTIERESDFGVEVFVKPSTYEIAYVVENNVKVSTTGTHAHLINLLTATPWAYLYKTTKADGSVEDYVRYRQLGAEVYLSIDVKGGIDWTVSQTLPEKFRPENDTYLPAVAYPSMQPAIVWVSSSGSVWMTGSQSSTDRVVTTVPFPIKE